LEIKHAPGKVDMVSKVKGVAHAQNRGNTHQECGALAALRNRSDGQTSDIVPHLLTVHVHEVTHTVQLEVDLGNRISRVSRVSS
jgi:hypothetical protein